MTYSPDKWRVRRYRRVFRLYLDAARRWALTPKGMAREWASYEPARNARDAANRGEISTGVLPEEISLFEDCP